MGEEIKCKNVIFFCLRLEEVRNQFGIEMCKKYMHLLPPEVLRSGSKEYDLKASYIMPEYWSKSGLVFNFPPNKCCPEIDCQETRPAIFISEALRFLWRFTFLVEDMVANNFTDYRYLYKIAKSNGVNSP